MTRNDDATTGSTEPGPAAGTDDDGVQPAAGTDGGAEHAGGSGDPVADGSGDGAGAGDGSGAGDGAGGGDDRAGGRAEADAGEPAELHRTSPLLRPTLALIGAVFVTALVVIVVVSNEPDLVGGVEFAELVVNGVAILAALLLIRLGMTLLVLWRTTYVVHEEGFRKEYELAYHSKSRELPVEQLRGREHERGRFETLFDCATIRLLTGGTDRSLGFVEFVQIPDPATVDEAITTVKRRNERREA